MYTHYCENCGNISEEENPFSERQLVVSCPECAGFYSKSIRHLSEQLSEAIEDLKTDAIERLSENVEYVARWSAAINKIIQANKQ